MTEDTDQTLNIRFSGLPVRCSWLTSAQDYCQFLLYSDLRNSTSSVVTFLTVGFKVFGQY